MIVSNVRAMIPRPIRRPLGIIRAVLTRLAIWRKVAVRVTGVAENDRVVLARAIRRAPLTVWSDLDRWQFPMVAERCTVFSRGVGFFRVRALTDDLFHALPGQEPAVEAAVRKTLRPGDIFVDAGANIGYYTVLASGLVGAKGHVISCEMIPETAKSLRDNVSLNKCSNVTVVEGALGAAAGQIIKASVLEGRSGQASIARKSGEKEIAVRTITLADVLRNTERIRLMKMDLEGAELGALQGLETDLAKVDTIIFENQGDSETIHFLSARDYQIRWIDVVNAVAERKDSVA